MPLFHLKLQRLLIGHIEAKQADALSRDLVSAWKKLGADAEQRQEDLENAVAAQNYLAAAADAQMWISVRFFL